ncbi:hypothetical protein CYJ27_02480 [Aerococcus christensenii]|uniref:Phage protein n=1 Tax=Aerococcus christensenii TaxID=87541 RepID=A0A2I1K7F3_9LACT|nr:hypothetical protein [Aerococcus christensenii]PKY91561.1 hypothetical protein CYJ27_02480 [Aerococcus christensenii]WEB70541.1 hypothetical protein PUW42_05595 [Aerococcus christensenii]
MELKLIIDGKEKRFKHNKTSLKVIRLANEMYVDMVRQLDNIAKMKLTDEPEDEEVDFEKINEDNLKEFDQYADLVIGYFSNQFTYDELINSPTFKNVSEFYMLGFQIIYELLDKKRENEEENQKKLVKLK